jgi:ATP-binding cassette subfamily B (MDR/TAP) protein 1
MEGGKTIGVPLPPYLKLSAEDSPTSDAEKAEMAKVPYASAVGSLIYAMVATRPDIAFAVGVVSRYMANPGKKHWEAVKGIMRYLKGTKDLCICFGKQKASVVGFTDADYAGHADCRKSTSGYVFTFTGGAVSWISRLQKCVALSTTEAEYVAATEACKEALWLSYLVRDLGITELPILHCDSQSAIMLARNPVFHAKTKHIEVKYHFIRDVLDSKNIELVKVHTNNNPADLLTKGLSAERFAHCRQMMGVG